VFYGDVNVLNVSDLERELNRVAAAAKHPPVKRWVTTVARNHILARLEEKDMASNFRVYNLAEKLDPLMPKLDALPRWAKEAMARGESVHWFDKVQPRRRILWQTLDMILLWFNTFKPDDTRFRQIDKISFDTAAKAGALWFKDINENIWLYVKDKPPVVQTYDRGIHWVRMVTSLHFEREGRLMHHCVDNGAYYNSSRRGQLAYYSLRDKANVPHATMEVRDSNVTQCKGHCNGKATASFQPYIRKFIADMKFTVTGDHHLMDLL
jgi:PcfJ-like protein